MKEVQSTPHCNDGIERTAVPRGVQVYSFQEYCISNTEPCNVSGSRSGGLILETAGRFVGELDQLFNKDDMNIIRAVKHGLRLRAVETSSNALFHGSTEIEAEEDLNCSRLHPVVEPKSCGRHLLTLMFAFLFRVDFLTYLFDGKSEHSAFLLSDILRLCRPGPCSQVTFHFFDLRCASQLMRNPFASPLFLVQTRRAMKSLSDKALQRSTCGSRVLTRDEKPSVA